jgi:hypothetical protein
MYDNWRIFATGKRDLLSGRNSSQQQRGETPRRPSILARLVAMMTVLFRHRGQFANRRKAHGQKSTDRGYQILFSQDKATRSARLASLGG